MSAMVVDSLGSGLFLLFSIVFFLRTTPLSLTAVRVSLSAAEVLALSPAAGLGWVADRLGPRLVIVIGNLARAARFSSGSSGSVTSRSLSRCRCWWTAGRACSGRPTRL